MSGCGLSHESVHNG